MTQKKIALVTGGSRGIGLEICKQLRLAGYWVASCSKIKPADETNYDFYLECDVGKKESVQLFFEKLFKKISSIDVLVNNAGLAGTNSLDNFSHDGDDLWNSIINTNLNGTYLFSKYSLQKMPATGKIINISSVLGLMGVPDQTAYCSAKHAIIGFTRSLSKAVAPRNITVNAVCPGWTETDMAQGRMNELNLSLTHLEQSVPMGRIIKPKEIADLVLFLCSHSAQNITGQTFTIDGGVTA